VSWFCGTGTYVNYLIEEHDDDEFDFVFEFMNRDQATVDASSDGKFSKDEDITTVALADGDDETWKGESESDSW